MPLAGPILADYYVVRKREYSTGAPDDLPNVRLPGIISFIVGAILGIVFQYFLPLPFDFPAGIGALIITFVLHIVLESNRFLSNPWFLLTRGIPNSIGGVSGACGKN